jgi:hypothetical protein
MTTTRYPVFCLAEESRTMSSTRSPHRFARSSAAFIILAAVTFSMSHHLVVHAVSVVTGPTVTLSDSRVGATSSYTFGEYRTDNERATGVAITFPDGFDVSQATAIAPPGSVEITGQTVVVIFEQPIPRQTPFTVSLDNIVNGLNGAYEFQAMTVFRIHQIQNRELAPDTDSGVIGPVFIGDPAISLTLSADSLEFDLYPEVPSEPQQVDLTVESTHDYTISREVMGDGDLFGLEVIGDAEGPKPAGISTFEEVYSAEVPWTTEGDRTYTATVIYTVVQ